MQAELEHRQLALSAVGQLICLEKGFTVKGLGMRA